MNFFFLNERMNEERKTRIRKKNESIDKRKKERCETQKDCKEWGYKRGKNRMKDRRSRREMKLDVE